MRLLAVTLATLVAASGCASLDGFLFAPSKVDEFRWDETDPNIDGTLTDPHPSIIGPADRTEGFVTAGDNDIHYVYARRAGATDTIFYSHGNTDHMGRYWDRVERLWTLGYNVMIYDYPGYGRSTGTPTEQSVYESALAAFAELSNMPGVDMNRVWLYGFSLGGAPTFELAARSERGELAPVRGLVTEAVFCSIEALVQDGAFLDVPREYVSTYSMDNCAKAESLTVPVLLLHGTADDYVVPRHAELIHARGPTTRLELIDGADHSDLPLVAGDGYDELVTGFVR